MKKLYAYLQCCLKKARIHAGKKQLLINATVFDQIFNEKTLPVEAECYADS